MTPPCTRVEHTVLDLIEMASSFEEAYDWICRAIGRRRSTADRYLDNLYDGYRACVDIDGMAAHPVDEQWEDKDRDRWNAVHEKINTIRIGVPHLRNRLAQCATASDVATWLSGRGPRTGHPCAANCPVP